MRTPPSSRPARGSWGQQGSAEVREGRERSEEVNREQGQGGLGSQERSREGERLGESRGRGS